MRTITSMVICVLCLQGCVSNPNKAQYIDLSMENKGQIGDRKIGLNDKQEVVMQEEQSAADELRVQEYTNQSMQENLNHEAFMLYECRKDLSDERLGGSGKIPSSIEADGMRTIEKIKEEIGLDDQGELKVVKKSYFLDRLKIERRYGVSLKRTTKFLERQRQECEYDMGLARRKAGLPTERYQGHGFYKDGVWIQVAPHENSLDDAFAIQAKQKQQAEQ